MESLKIGITGAGGYIGSRVAKLVVEEDHEIVPLDNHYNSQIESVKGQDIIDQDVRDIEGLREKLDEVDVILHLAAITGIPECEEKEELAYEVNVEGTQNVARICEDENIPLVFPMSMQVFGNVTEFPITTEKERKPVNNYGKTKAISEKTIEILSESSFPAHVYIKSNVYGSHKVGDIEVNKGTVVNYFVECAQNEKDLTVHSPGYQSKDFIHVKDVVNAYLESIEKIQQEDDGKKVFLLASGESTSIKQLAEKISWKNQQINDFKPDIRIVENPRENDVLVEKFDVSVTKTADSLGYEANYELEESLEEMLIINE